MVRMPTMFIPHGGGPCFFMDWDPPETWDCERAFLKNLPKTLPAKPTALLVISGHWEEPQFTVQTNPAPPLLFDYGGFPAHTYELTWPAPGDPDLAKNVKKLLENAGFACAENNERGYDHGVFVPLKVAFPAADIPTVQLSLRQDMDAQAHIDVGKALAPLRDRQVLIIGSGNTYHNLTKMIRSRRGDADARPKGVEFDRWLTDVVTQPDLAPRERQLVDWAQAPGARDANPREEHLLPLHVVAGAAQNDRGVKTLEDYVMGAVESGFTFG